MANLNKVLLIGNLTRDPEILWTPKGTAVCKGGLAVNRKWKGPDGVMQEETCFVDFSLFGKQAETFQQYMRKGRPVFLEGRLKLDQWESEGQKRSKLRVVVESFQFMGGRGEGDGDFGGGAPRGQQNRGFANQPAPARTASSNENGGGWNSRPPSSTPPQEAYQESYDELGDEDIPF